MNLTHVSIKNFKGVKNMELDFAPGVNLLIGDNGVGKTSVLEAIAVGLAGMLKGIPGVPVKTFYRVIFDLRQTKRAMLQPESDITALQKFPAYYRQMRENLNGKDVARMRAETPERK